MTELYWSRVKACLVEFHKLSDFVARKKVQHARECFDTPFGGRKPSEDEVEHIDAFHMACMITKHKLELSKHFDLYQKLLNRTRNRALARNHPRQRVQSKRTSSGLENTSETRKVAGFYRTGGRSLAVMEAGRKAAGAAKVTKATPPPVTAAAKKEKLKAGTPKEAKKKAATPKIAKRKVATSKITKQKSETPKTTKRKAATPKTAKRRAATPKMAKRKASTSKTAKRRAATPKMTKRKTSTTKTAKRIR